jgi:ligand-binding sensor domain-containing protein
MYNKILLFFFLSITTISLYGQSWNKYNQFNSNLPAFSAINSIVVDNSNTKWLGTNLGLVKIENDTLFTIYNTSNSNLNNDDITCLELDKNNLLWIGTASTLMTFDGSNFEDKTTSKMDGDKILDMKFDNSNNIWLVSEYTGMWMNDGLNWTQYKYTGEPIPLVFPVKLSIDKNDVKWVLFSGVVKYGSDTLGNLRALDNGNWSYYYDPLMKASDYYSFDIEIDDADNKWIATSYGLSKFDGVNWSNFKASNQNNLAPSSTIRSIHLDANNNIWCGMSSNPSGNANILKFKDGNWTNYNYQNTNSIYNQSDILSISSDLNSTIWFGSSFFLFSYKETQLNVGELPNIDQNSLIYPNPSNGKFSLQMNSEIKKIEIHNVLGKKIDFIRLNENDFDLINATNGIYLISVINQHGISRKYKMNVTK